MKQILFIIKGSQAERELVAELISFTYQNPVNIDGNFSDLLESDKCAFAKCKSYTDLVVINHIGVGRIYPLSRAITGHLAVKPHGKSHFFINPDAVVICTDMVNKCDILANFPAGTFRVLEAVDFLAHTAIMLSTWKK